jgi:type I restriction-modification system DNA methylase subunit
MEARQTCITKSKQRVAGFGEIYTSPHEVKAMLDLVKQETEHIESRFLEPACGNGNFLIEVLARKLEKIASRYARRIMTGERNWKPMRMNLYIWKILRSFLI